MLNKLDEVIEKLNNETNRVSSIIFREKKINNKRILIIFNEPLISSDKVSDFVIRSLNKIKGRNLVMQIENNISNFKYTKINTYDELCFYLHKGFTIILIDKCKTALALETKARLNRSISVSDVENTVRGPKDSFVEEYQTNIGLIRKRIKTNDLWISELNLGKLTSTQVGVIYINKLADDKKLKIIIEKLNNINRDSVVNIGEIKKYFEKRYAFPAILTSQRPDVISKALLDGKIIIAMDNNPFMLILPINFSDFFKTSEDIYNRKTNKQFIRSIKYFAFWLTILLPGIYIALVTVNQEIIPTKLLISFAIQRDGVPFPAAVEALIMLIIFEILRECDLRVPNFAGSALSIVGALILGEAAVNAGIVSPIMIIIIALTAICSLPFTEMDFINSLRIHRILCISSVLLLGIIGLVIFIIVFLIRLISMNPFENEYFCKSNAEEYKWKK